MIHPSMFMLWSREPFENVSAFLAKQSSISTVIRPHGSGQYVAAILPRVAEAIKRLIALNKTTKKAPNLIVHKIAHFRLRTTDLPNPELQSTFQFFVRLPKRMPWKPLKKHLDIFFERIRGLGLVEAKQYDIEIPLTSTRSHHRGQCVIWFDTKEQAERKKERQPNRQIKISGRASEKHLPFVRYLLNDSTWFANIPLLDNDPQPNHPNTQIPPSYSISCEWDRLNNE